MSEIDIRNSIGGRPSTDQEDSFMYGTISAINPITSRDPTPTDIRPTYRSNQNEHLNIGVLSQDPSDWNGNTDTPGLTSSLR